MKFPFFASFIVFCIWLGYEIHKQKNKEAQADQEFWRQEAAANNTRRKSLDDLEYITIPFESLPMNILTQDPRICDYHQTLQTLSAAPIVNFTGISNTELKLRYGVPNLELLSRYDQSYTTLVRTLQSWAEVLFENDYVKEAACILEFAVSTRTDVSGTYKLLIRIYKQNGTLEKIKDLLPVAESLNSGMKNSILALLQEELP